MNYSQKNCTFKQYGLRRRKPLETIQESDLNGSNSKPPSAPEDAFDQLFHSPMKQQVTLKPLSHWAKKLADLEKQSSHSNKMKDLYEMSSPDESSPYRKMKKKPKPRKKKENSNLFDGLLAKNYKSLKTKPVASKPRETKKAVNLMKIPLNGVELKAKNRISSTACLPLFGLTSTPDKTKRNYLTEPSFYNFCSPIVTEKIAMKLSSAINHTPKSKRSEKNIVRPSIPMIKASIKESIETNPVSDHEQLVDGFLGFSPLPDDQIKLVKDDSNEIQHNDDCPMSIVSVQGQNRNKTESHTYHSVKDEALTPSTDKNVTLRRKYKRSYESQSPLSDLSVLPTNELSNDYITFRRPKRKTTSKKSEQNEEIPNDNKNSQRTSGLYDIMQSDTSPIESKISANSIIKMENKEKKTATTVRTNSNVQKLRKSLGVYKQLHVTEEKKERKNNDSNSEVSPYFPNEVKSSSDSSFIMDSPKSQKTMVNITNITKLHNQNEIICESIMNKTLACLNSTLVLRGGKQHNRARVVLRQLQTGRLTLHNTTLLPQVPIGRGRGYETFVGGLLEMQPGLEETLQNVTCKSPILQRAVKDRTRLTNAKPNDSVAPSRTRFSCKRKSQDFHHLSRFNEKNNKTVIFADDVSPRPVAAWRNSVRGHRRISRVEKPTHVSNLSVRVIPLEQHEKTICSSTFGIHDTTAFNIGETGTDTVIPWSARDAVLSKCNQSEPVSFSEHFNELTLPECKKIGEGVYGEVFMYSSILGPTVFKVIPIEGDVLVNDEPQKTFTEILSEIVISMELSNLRHGKEQQSSGYAELRRTWCVQGEYPDFLVELWNDYDIRKGSENDTPTMFSADQLYIVLELAHGGLDLEAFVFRNAAQSLSAFRQAVFSLAVAERALEFEHRDFHWGNVLVSETTEKCVTFALNGQQFKIPSEGVKVTIIDFTLSRITFEGCSVFNDLSVDPGLFTSEGDYQFEIYRMMRDETKNNWEQFTPRTNVFWLHYTLDKMLSLVRYSRPKSKPHSTAVNKLRKFKECALEYLDSAKFAVSTL